MEAMMADAWTVLGRLLLAALLGVVGHLVRVVVGLKKEHDKAAAAGKTLKDNFDAQELLVSLAIAVAVGAVAGVLSAVATGEVATTRAAMLALMGAGYSGTDAI